MIQIINLLQELIKPASVGIFYDGERIFLAEDAAHPGRRPARAFIAVSHRELFFHTFKVSKDLNFHDKQSAAKLEAQRIFSLLKGRPPQEIVCAVLEKKPDELVIAFQEESYFEKLLSRLPKGLIPCGIMPAMTAVASFFFRKKGLLPDGLYYLKTRKAYEGFISLGGNPIDFLPSSIGAAQSYLNGWQGAIYTEEGKTERYLAEGARLVSCLPSSWAITFDKYPLKFRPRFSSALAALWLLPVAFFVLAEILNFQATKIEKERIQVDLKLQQITQEISRIEELRRKEQTAQKLEQLLKDFETENINLVPVIVRLTQIIPQDTWVRKLEFRAPDELRLWAEGENALKVLKLIDQDPWFEEVKFLTTVMKNSRTGKEIFSLVIKVKSDLIPRE